MRSPTSAGPGGLCCRFFLRSDAHLGAGAGSGLGGGFEQLRGCSSVAVPIRMTVVRLREGLLSTPRLLPPLK